jgi:hypothetical protein
VQLVRETLVVRRVGAELLGSVAGGAVDRPGDFVADHHHGSDLAVVDLLEELGERDGTL